MLHPPEVEGWFGTLARRAHSGCPETAGLSLADREDAAQDALLVLCRRWAISSNAAELTALAHAFGGVLRNTARHVRRRRRMQERVRSASTGQLDGHCGPEPDLTDDWRMALSPQEREWLEGFEGAASDQDLAARWGVHVATVSRRRSRLCSRLGDVLQPRAGPPRFSSGSPARERPVRE